MSIRGKGHYLTLAKGHLDFKNKIMFFSETINLFRTELLLKAYGWMGMKIYTNE